MSRAWCCRIRCDHLEVDCPSEPEERVVRPHARVLPACRGRDAKGPVHVLDTRRKRGRRDHDVVEGGSIHTAPSSARFLSPAASIDTYSRVRSSIMRPTSQPSGPA